VIVGLVIAVIVVILAIATLSSAVNMVQQGFMGVITRFGKFHREVGPGIRIVIPIFDRLVMVDMRETPRTGDRQDVITRDNVAVAVNATIFNQVIDAKAALFNVSNFTIAIDQQARTTLRNAFGNVSLDEALSQREQINAAMQLQMEQVTDKWGIRINRIEIVDISPPSQILQAMALQKQADQEKRAKILQSEGAQQSAVNIADGNRQAVIKQAEGERQSLILRAEGARQAAILEAEGRALAIGSVYKAIKAASPDPTLVAILQLDTLSKFADSPNTTIVIPAEASALMGAAQAIKSVLASVPGADGAAGPAVTGPPPSR
jgi:regulator of protease activity HflC (stomatin/prohibitin superfamily)